jgi:Probable lipoprotein LpqN
MANEPLARRATGHVSTRTWLAALSGAAAGVAGIVCLTSPTAVAEPALPVPAPVTVTQTVTVAPMATVPTPQVGVAPAGAPGVTQAGVSGMGQAAVTPGRAQPSTVPGYPATAPPVVPAATAPNASPALVAATSGTLTDYFTGKHVTLEPQLAQGFQALNITLPMPPGWTQVPDPNVPNAFAVIANRASPDLYTPNAQLVVYRLVGNFDPNEAITHGFIDAQSLPAWQSTDAALGDFYGFPSSQIEGTYRQNDMTLNTSRRHVIATSGPDRYLVSLSVTSLANRQGAPSSADATNAIVNGFKVAAPAPPAAPRS